MDLEICHAINMHLISVSADSGGSSGVEDGFILLDNTMVTLTTIIILT